MRTFLINFFLLIPLVICAQWTPDPWTGMVSVCHEDENQQHIQVLNLGNGNTFIGWDDSRDFPSSDDVQIYYQVLDRYGLPLFETNGIKLIEGDWVNLWWSTSENRVLPDGEGGCVAVFVDKRAGFNSLYGQRITPWGERLWGDQGVPFVVWPDNDILLDDITSDSLGHGFIAWNKNLSPLNEAYVQRFDLATGETSWGELGVMVCGGVSFCAYQEIVMDGQGGIYDLWEDGRIISNSLYVQHVDFSGNITFSPNGIFVRHVDTGNPISGLLWEGVTDGSGQQHLDSGPNWFCYQIFRIPPGTQRTDALGVDDREPGSALVFADDQPSVR